MAVKALQFKKIFNNVSTRNKLLLSYIAVVFIPVLLVGLILTFNMKRMAVERAISEATNNVNRIYDRFNETLKLAMDVASKTYIDQNLQEILQTRYDSTEAVMDAYSGYSELSDYASFYYQQFADIKIYTGNTTLLDSVQFEKITDDILKTPWFNVVASGERQFLWQYVYNPRRARYFLSLTSMIRKLYTNQPLGVLVISIQEDYLNSIIRNEPYDTMIIDDNQRVIAAKQTALVSRYLQDIGLDGVLGTGYNEAYVEYNGETSMVILKRLKPSNSNGVFTIISIIPIHEIEAPANRISRWGLFLIGASLLMAFVLIIFFTGAISRRVKKLSRDIHTVAMGNFDTVPEIEGEDEIGQLSRDLGVMVKSLKDLVHEVYEVNLQKNQLTIRQRDIKLKMLASQINPHFLFNALETIRMKAYCKGEQEIAGAVKLLGRIMRKNLEAGSEPIKLESELELVQSYLEIQKFRYGDKISYRIAVNDDVKGYPILPLLIQPVVENAIIHGLEAKEGKGLVTVSMGYSDNLLNIKVEDDGMGMTAEKLQQVLRTFDETSEALERRIGLKNVHQRIKLYYGEKYGLTLRSEIGTGTTVEMVLPEKGWFNASVIDCGR